MVAGNWKMNGSRASARDLVEGIKAGIINFPQAGMTGNKSVQIVICPPYVYLADCAALLKGTSIALGAQNLYPAPAGAYTGEISAAMLVDFQCRYVIVGHSERRALCGESDGDVANKVIAAVKAGLTPILCVGEQLDERETGRTKAVVARQLDAVLHSPSGMAALAHAVIAYEPVWAIGTGMTASPQQAQEVHAFIRQRIAEYNADLANKIQLLYGGSVKAANAAELFSMPDIDGGLIGGASLQASEFLAICRAAG